MRPALRSCGALVNLSKSHTITSRVCLFLGLPLIVVRGWQKKSPSGLVTRWGFFYATAAGKARPTGQALPLLALGGQVGGGGGVREGAALPCPARAAALRAAAAGRDAADHGPKPGPGCCAACSSCGPLR